MTTLTAADAAWRLRRYRSEFLMVAARRHGVDATLVLGLLIAAATVHGVNMFNNPITVTNDDPGTYVAQAWAVLNSGELANYTYWYDHPPVGWLQLAGWAWLTDAFDRLPTADAVGREFMLVMRLLTVVTMWAVARRVGLNRGFAVLAVLLFVLNPLALYYGRQTYLDSITLPWILAAFYSAASPRSHLFAYAASALFFIMAVLTKETALILLPALIYQACSSSDRRTRLFSLSVMLTLFATGCMSYVLLATVKGELLPGPNHVDLWSAIRWQLFDRAGSGSVLDPTSAASATVRAWLAQDSWLFLLSIAAVPVALFPRSLRPLTVALAVQLLMLLRSGGYLPGPYIITVLPFAALVVAAGLDTVWKSWQRLMAPRAQRRVPLLVARAVPAVTKLSVIAVIALFSWSVVALRWMPQVGALMTEDSDATVRQTFEWIDENIPRDSVLLVGHSMWVDLVEMGFERQNVIWYFKLDLDKEVQAVVPRGWQDVDFVVMTPEMTDMVLRAVPVQTTKDALSNGSLIASFGEGSKRMAVYQVNN